VEVPIDDAVIEHWRTRFEELEAKEKKKGVELIFVLIDGFLLYYDPVSQLIYSKKRSLKQLNLQECVKYYDVLFFLRVPYATLKQRREERAQYVTQSESRRLKVDVRQPLMRVRPFSGDPSLAKAGDVWQDPPHYFDNIVYPAYVDAHKHLFTNQDVEKGELAPNWYLAAMGPNAVLAGENNNKVAEIFTPAEGSEGMQEMVAKGLERIYEVAVQRTSS
jgi:nicotinamide/nicotinate riboside kinase